MTRILLTRHGYVEGIKPPRFRGHKDLPLTSTGREQAQQLAVYLATHSKLDAIYTSPLSRAIDTGAEIAAATSVKASVMAQLSDIDYGDWTGKSHDEVERTDPQRYAQWWTQPQLVRPPNGESLQDLVARTSEALREIIHCHPDEQVLLIGHDSTNRALLLTLLDLPFSAFRRFEQAPCNLTEVEVSSEGIRVLSVNETQHLQNSILSSVDAQQKSEEQAL